MKALQVLIGLVFPLALLAEDQGDFVKDFDSVYNTMTVEKQGSIVELRARSRRGTFIESAVDLNEPRRLVVPYTKTLFAALFLQPRPKRVLMIGLGGAAFPRLFTAAFPDSLLQSVELDPKVFELCQTYLAFHPTDRTPVAISDGRLYIKRHPEKWDWIILDAFRGGFVSPHLKTAEFYSECASRLNERGVLVTNLHNTTQLYYSDLRTLCSVFPQVILFHTAGTGNVIACAVNYSEPNITRPANWAKVDLDLLGWVNMGAIAKEYEELPKSALKEVKILTDDFAPVEFLNAMDANNTTEGPKHADEDK